MHIFNLIYQVHYFKWSIWLFYNCFPNLSDFIVMCDWYNNIIMQRYYCYILTACFSLPPYLWWPLQNIYQPSLALSSGDIGGDYHQHNDLSHDLRNGLTSDISSDLANIQLDTDLMPLTHDQVWTWMCFDAHIQVVIDFAVDIIYLN